MAEAKIYTKPSCPYCAAAKSDLAERGISFDDIDVTADPAALAELVEVSGGRKVPVIVEADNVTIGFGGG